MVTWQTFSWKSPSLKFSWKILKFLIIWGPLASQATGLPLQHWNTIQPQWNQKAFLDEKILIDKHQYWWFSTLSLRRTVCHPKNTTWVNLTLALKLLKRWSIEKFERQYEALVASGDGPVYPKYRHISHNYDHDHDFLSWSVKICFVILIITQISL